MLRSIDGDHISHRPLFWFLQGVDNGSGVAQLTWTTFPMKTRRPEEIVQTAPSSACWMSRLTNAEPAFLRRGLTARADGNRRPKLPSDGPPMRHMILHFLCHFARLSGIARITDAGFLRPNAPAGTSPEARA
jgi:hypothetical protein